ncbi:ThiF family adenylyltransferase, partial [Tyzzerella sp. OttesenSCG-928-J15]|nr:ThiF family adenylyltransferase [Tyzzerella sp. OttesenSCG-928-J15]
TIGMKKTQVGAQRAKDINGEININALDMFFLNKTDIDFSQFDYVIDAIDNVTGKLAIAESCYEKNVPLISAMGCGNRKDYTALKQADIYETSGCPLCKVMRKELKARGINRLNVIYSAENYVKTGERTPGSTSFVPAIAGLMLAGAVINHLAAK